MANATPASFIPTLQAANNQTAPSSPLGNFPELANYSRIRFQLPDSNAAVGGLGAVTQANVNNADAAAEAARAQQKAALEAKLQNVQDAAQGKNFKQVLKPDGGYDYYDPLGNQINLNQFSQATGKQPTEILAHSQNALDIQHNKDFTNLQNLLNVMISGDKKGQAALFKKEPDLKKSIAGLTPDQLIQQFRNAYPNVYGVTGNGSIRPQGQSPYQPATQHGGPLSGSLGGKYISPLINTLFQ